MYSWKTAGSVLVPGPAEILNPSPVILFFQNRTKGVNITRENTEEEWITYFFMSRLLIVLASVHFLGDTVDSFCTQLPCALLCHKWQNLLCRSQRSAAHGLKTVCRNQRGAPHAARRRNKVCRRQWSGVHTGNPLGLKICRLSTAKHRHPLD